MKDVQERLDDVTLLALEALEVELKKMLVKVNGKRQLAIDTFQRLSEVTTLLARLRRAEPKAAGRMADFSSMATEELERLVAGENGNEAIN